LSRRVLTIMAVVLALLGIAHLIQRGTRPALVERSNAVHAALVVPSSAPSPASAPAESFTSEPRGASPPENAAVLTAESAPAPSPARAPVPQANGLTDVDPHKAFGSKNAPVAMEVFSDFQCPACKSLYTTTNRPIVDNYVTAGKVYLIHRDFPLPVHAHSRVAARYSRAAAQLGKGESVEQALFANQEKWEQSGDVDGTVASVLSPAEMTKVRALVKGGTLEPLIDRDYALGQTYHVNQTPTIVFHAKGQTYPVAGVMSYEVLRGFIDQLLNQK
jgi:protein-disulfide isomerase